MSILAIVLIIFVGFVLFLLEFLIIPGITIAGIAGFLFVAGGIFCGYYYHGQAVGNLILLITGLSMFTMFIIVLKSKTWKRVGLKSTIDGRVGVIESNELHAGDEGMTVSKLSPIGKAMINGKLYEVRSYGNYLESNLSVRITSIEGNKIFVEPKN
jgi:membrane-bound ClpP family serine protease